MNVPGTHPGKSPRTKLRLTPVERRASITLALLFASRMLGLFLLTPIFAVAAQAIPGGNDAAKVGLALGAYGLTQAIMQIPLGMASDRFGRRPVIVFGMLLFIAGGVNVRPGPKRRLDYRRTDNSGPGRDFGGDYRVGGRCYPPRGAYARHGASGQFYRHLLRGIPGAFPHAGRANLGCPACSGRSAC